MHNNLTEVVFILDRSGSMSGMESDVIGGFNSTLSKQRKEKGRCLVSTVLFNDVSKVIHDREPINNIRNLTEKDYSVSGCTALLDALGDSIKYIKRAHKIVRKEDVPENTIFIITTDGYENASHKYTSDQIKEMIHDQEKISDWKFIYLAANIDAIETGQTFGMKVENSHNYINDRSGNDIVYKGVGDFISAVRCNDEIKCKVAFNMCDADYKKRSKKKK